MDATSGSGVYAEISRLLFLFGLGRGRRRKRNGVSGVEQEMENGRRVGEKNERDPQL